MTNVPCLRSAHIVSSCYDESKRLCDQQKDSAGDDAPSVVKNVALAILQDGVAGGGLSG
jgi:hypothetical protein